MGAAAEKVGDGVLVYGVSVDPDGDTPERAKAFIKRRGPAPGAFKLPARHARRAQARLARVRDRPRQRHARGRDRRGRGDRQVPRRGRRQRPGRRPYEPPKRDAPEDAARTPTRTRRPQLPRPFTARAGPGLRALGLRDADRQARPPARRHPVRATDGRGPRRRPRGAQARAVTGGGGAAAAPVCEPGPNAGSGGWARRAGATRARLAADGTGAAARAVLDGTGGPSLGGLAGPAPGLPRPSRPALSAISVSGRRGGGRRIASTAMSGPGERREREREQQHASARRPAAAPYPACAGADSYSGAGRLLRARGRTQRQRQRPSREPPHDGMRSYRAPRLWTVTRQATRSWLMDMDGVLVHEEQAIAGADRFLANLRKREAPHLVLTNNSIYTRRDLAARLRSSGLEVPEESIWTSALATSSFLEDQPPGGLPLRDRRGGLTAALHEAGYPSPSASPLRGARRDADVLVRADHARDPPDRRGCALHRHQPGRDRPVARTARCPRPARSRR